MIQQQLDKAIKELPLCSEYENDYYKYPILGEGDHGITRIVGELLFRKEQVYFSEIGSYYVWMPVSMRKI